MERSELTVAETGQPYKLSGNPRASDRDHLASIAALGGGSGNS